MNNRKISKLSCIIDDVALLNNYKDKHSFPKLITLFRKALCITREKVAKDIGISSSLLFYLEAGAFKKYVEKEIIQAMATYFGLDYHFLNKKMIEHVDAN